MHGLHKYRFVRRTLDCVPLSVHSLYLKASLLPLAIFYVLTLLNTGTTKTIADTRHIIFAPISLCLQATSYSANNREIYPPERRDSIAGRVGIYAFTHLSLFTLSVCM